MPTDLKSQEDLMFGVLSAFDIPMISLAWFEADDIIWTLAVRLKENKENDIYILSWDKDLYQFVDDNVAIYDTMKRKISHQKEAIEKFWVEPKHIVDYLAICWDSSDNIPWISGFWPKKAQELINKYWSLEEIYENIDNITGKTNETLAASHEVAFLSKQLASINTELDLPWFHLDNHIFKEKNIFTENAINLLKKYEFKSLIPSHHQDEIKNFDTLWIKQVKISDSVELTKLESKIYANGKIAISTTWNWSFELESVSFYIWEKEIYYINTSEFEIIDFLRKLISSDLEIIWFDIKEDLKRILWYLEWRWQKWGSSTNEFQVSLF
jgi:DNA polymerase-1